MMAQNIDTNTYLKPTTEEEYNYITKGYKIQIESGLDMKKGYSFKDITPGYSLFWDNGKIERNVKFKALFRDGEERPCAMLVRLERIGGITQYFCIPSYNADKKLWDALYKSMRDLEDYQKWLLLYATNYLASYYFSFN